jgi:hypothetical protein
MNKFVVLSMLVLLSSCGTPSGRIGGLPAIRASEAAGKVVTIRVSSVIGAGSGYTVAMDGQDLYGIGSGEHAEFPVSEGEHQITVKCFGGWSPSLKEHSLKFVASPSKTSFFVISPNWRCAAIRPLEEVDARKVLQGSKRVSLKP